MQRSLPLPASGRVVTSTAESVAGSAAPEKQAAKTLFFIQIGGSCAHLVGHYVAFSPQSEEQFNLLRTYF